MELWDRLDAAAERLDVLRHPFYVRWSEGTLSRAEIGLYAGQYAHAVRALAAAARSVAGSPEAAAHAAEEESHIELWDEFARAVGAGPATAYFDVHAERDVEHARAGRTAISEVRSDASDDGALVAEAERVLAANWRLLDGVERASSGH